MALLPATMAVLGLPGPRPPDTGDVKKIVLFGDDACRKTSLLHASYTDQVPDFEVRYTT